MTKLKGKLQLEKLLENLEFGVIVQNLLSQIMIAMVEEPLLLKNGKKLLHKLVTINHF